MSPGWIFRDLQTQDDFGVDAEIEIVVSGEVPGRLIKAQIKGTADLDDDQRSCRINVDTFDMLVSLNLPVVFFLHDGSATYWAHLFESTPLPGTKTMTIHFDRKLEAVADLEAYEATWRQAHVSDACHQLAMSLRHYEQVAEITSCIPPAELDPDVRTSLHEFLRLLTSIRLLLGVSSPRVPTIREWENATRSPLDEQTASALIAFLRPAYLTAVHHLAKRFEATGEAWDRTCDGVLSGLNAPHLNLTDDHLADQRWVVEWLGRLGFGTGATPPEG